LVWDDLILLSKNIEKLFDLYLIRSKNDEDIKFEGWCDKHWESLHFRKCHMQIIDNRDTQKLWLMHINIFPDTPFDTPILGFDIVAGQNKITGAFFDYSPIGEEHPYIDYFRSRVENISWNKQRELPEWAKNIFSKHMIAAGNIRSKEEIQQLSKVCFELIEYYIMNTSSYGILGDYKEKQNYYCKQQKLNPHLHKSILAMGIPEHDKDRYVNKVLFEEIL
jgi:hypothetical protein